jgi:hypothetical protein
LPASVYPTPKAPKRKVVASTKAPAEVAPDPAAEADRRAGLPPKVIGNVRKAGMARAATEAPAAEVREPPAPPRRPVKQVMREAVAALELDRHLRRIFRPVRLVLAGVAVVVGLTGWWIVHQRDRDAAERTIVSAVKLGEQALGDHDMVEAARQFQQVRAALDLLGRTDHQARALRQTANEMTAAADLCRSSLFDVLHDAAESESGKSHVSWDETFRAGYRDEWVVIDALVSRSADPAAAPKYDIDFLVTDGRNRAVIVADLDLFDRVVVTAASGPQRVIFAGQLDDCRKDPQVADAWRIVLRPTTGFLWSSVANFELLGVDADSTTKQLLAEQTSRLGISQ